MKRSWPFWIGLPICLAMLFGAMGWISLTVVRLDRAQRAASRRAVLEDNARLALWRIDSALAPLVAQESVRPVSAYRPQYNGLLPDAPPSILAHFQLEPGGRLTLLPAAPQAAREKLAAALDLDRLTAALPAGSPRPFVSLDISPESVTAQRNRRIDAQSRGRGAVELSERGQIVASNTRAMTQVQNQLVTDAPSNVVGGLMTPLWIDGQLILARRVTAGGDECVQGCLLDWPALRASLLASIEDLLPGADLRPVAAGLVDNRKSSTRQFGPFPQDRRAPVGSPGVTTNARLNNEELERMSAALPVRLEPGELAVARGEERFSPIQLSLVIAWSCVLLAAVAVAVLLWGMVRLSQRRAMFTSAVTHELRTPLTTFQIYAEMLAEDMVPDEAARKRYLDTLSSEAKRLTHLVENVLAYARLERGRLDRRGESIGVDELLEPIGPRLAALAERANMELVVAIEPDAEQSTVRVTPSAVEQILFNLVDNACKYAAGVTESTSDNATSDDRRIELCVRRQGRAVEVGVRDFGPGLSPAVRRRLFRSFTKSARQAAHSAPGVGLGLALSRRLARAMGGDLHYDKQMTDGARFVLTLPTG